MRPKSRLLPHFVRFLERWPPFLIKFLIYTHQNIKKRIKTKKSSLLLWYNIDMSNRYGCFTPLPPERRSQMAKDAAFTRRILHPTKDDIDRGAQYLSSLSETERQRVYKARNNQVSIFSVLMGLAFISIPLLFIALWFG